MNRSRTNCSFIIRLFNVHEERTTHFLNELSQQSNNVLHVRDFELSIDFGIFFSISNSCRLLANNLFIFITIVRERFV